MTKLKEDAYILRTNNGDTWQVEDGHTLKEYRDNFGVAYDDGELWDFSEEDVKSGAIEAQPNMVYWKIKVNGDEPRYFETTIFDEWDIHECKEELGESEEKLDEGTSNFRTPDYFPLLVFYTYDEFLYNMEHDSDYPDIDNFENEDGDIDYDAYDDARDTFEQEYWDNNEICVLDEDEQERLDNKLWEFNEETKRIADELDVDEDGYQSYGPNINLADVELKVEPGYYSGAYIDIDNERSLNYCDDKVKEEQIKRINDFLEALRKEFGLTKLGVAWGPASNGETGYKILNDSLKEAKIEEAREKYEIEYWVDEEARDQGLGDIAIETFDNLEDAKAYADKLFGEVASVEVLDANGNVVYGRYPEDESLQESTLNEGHQGFTYKGYDIDWNDDDLDLENGIDGLNIVIRVGNKDGKEVATVKSFKEAREWCDKNPLPNLDVSYAKAFADSLSKQLEKANRDDSGIEVTQNGNEVEINVEGNYGDNFSWYAIFGKDGSVSLKFLLDADFNDFDPDNDEPQWETYKYDSLEKWFDDSYAGMFLQEFIDCDKVIKDTLNLSVSESLQEEKGKKYALMVNGEWYSTFDSYDKAAAAKARFESALEDDEEGQKYYGSYPNVDIVSINEDKTNKLEESPENPSTHLGYKEDGEEVIKQVGHSYLLKKGNRYIVRYAPGYYVNDIRASSDEEAINKFLGLDESIQKLAERKSKKKLKFRYTGDPAKDAAFFNHCQGTDVGDVGVEASSVSLGEEEVKESLDDYYVVSDGKDPRHSYVFSENGRETALNMLKDYKGNGYWEVLHYVKGNPIMIYNTRDGAIEEK